MTTPRSYQIDLSVTPYYHCISRCVRRSYLCGYDRETKKDFSHRKQWILDRIKHLARVFYIDICAYAIMSNHYHLVLHVDKTSSKMASLDELLFRWQLVFPAHALKLKKIIDSCDKNKEKIEKNITCTLQDRLSNISWYMRCLNELIAKMANKEDNCKGRFWEGRFRSQALLDEGALLSAMVYVDLNPIRAGISVTPESSDFTSIQERIQYFYKTNNNKAQMTDLQKNQPADLMPFSLESIEKNNQNTINFTLEDYFILVDTTGRIIREGKKGSIPNSITPILERLQLNQNGWLKMISGIETNFYYAIGHPAYLKELMPRLCHSKLKHLDFVELCYLEFAA